MKKIDLTKDLNRCFGNNIEILKSIPDNSIDCCVTSPPYYGLRSYLDDDDPKKVDEIGLEESPDAYIARMVALYSEIRRTLKPEGTCFINIGDSYYNYRGGKGQALTKQTSSKTKQDLPDKCARRANKHEGLKEKDLIGIPWMLAFALRADGWYLRQEIIWAKACSGIHRGGTVMPESCKDRFVRSHEQVFLLTKNSHYFFDIDAIAEKQAECSLNRAFSNNHMEKRKGIGDEQYSISGKSQAKSYEKLRKKIESGEEITRNRRSVWTINTRPSKISHFASYPAELIEPMILSGCPVGGIVLDPFAGTGTTGIVANLHGRKALLLELNDEYKPLYKKRLAEITKQHASDGKETVAGKIVKKKKLF